MYSTPGVTPLNLQIRHHLINSFSLTDKWISFCENYFLLSKHGTEVADMVENGEILYNGAIYKINWLSLPSACYRSQHVLLSFRRGIGMRYGYVLIVTKADSVNFGAKE